MTPDDFLSALPFEADEFQRESIEAMQRKSAVVVAAPTGSGKTVVGEYACRDALSHGQRCFYATPLKALSNQKFSDFNALWGNTGLLTGDNSISPQAPIVVMTTEVLRNMIYADPSSLSGLRWVVLDEVHYLQDRSRGGVWEEVIVNLPASVGLVCLSATISNHAQFTDWLQTVRGSAEAVVSATRPVDLHPVGLVGTKLYDIVEDGRIATEFEDAWSSAAANMPRGRSKRPDRIHIARILEQRKLLPAIYFIFSRAGCDDAATMVGHRSFVSSSESKEIRRRTEERAAFLTDREADAIGYSSFLATISAGVAPHHAGMIPLFRELVEELFSKGLVKLVFATETLSLGINMPAKSVVIENLTKFDGVSRALLTPLQFTQLTGRAGRRGIDVEGHGIVVFDSRVDPKTVSSLVTQVRYELSSSFSPNYNMAVNLLARHTPSECVAILNSSFAQFSANREIVAMQARLRRGAIRIAELEVEAQCELGDVAEYAALLGEPKATDEVLLRASSALVMGDVIYDERYGRLLILEPLRAMGRRAARLTAMTADRKLRRLSAGDFAAPPESVHRVRLTANGWRSPKVRRRIDQELQQLDRSMKTRVDSRHRKQSTKEQAKVHPVAKCPKARQHLKLFRELQRLEAQATSLEQRITNSSGNLAGVFSALCDVMRNLEFLEGDALTDKGRVLRGVYNKGGLMAVQCLERGLLESADVAELAAFASLFCFDSTDAEGGQVHGIDPKRMRRIARIAEEVSETERNAGLKPTTQLVEVFSGPAADWVEGSELDEVLSRWNVVGGDFVRSAKQVADFMEQLASAASGDVAGRLSTGAKTMRRGLVGRSPVGAAEPSGLI